MATIADATASWSFCNPIAQVRCGELSGQIDVAHPDCGLRPESAEQLCPGGQLLIIRRSHGDQSSSGIGIGNVAAWPLALSEAYVRGDDLIASYEPREDWPFSPQIYWRAKDLPSIDGVCGALSVLVSVQTHLLDTWPRITIQSCLACDELLHITTSNGSTADTKLLDANCVLRPSIDQSCLVHRLAGMPLSYIEIMPASDFQELRVEGSRAGGWRSEWELFGEFLEKGVIRRARLQAAVVARANDLELAAACCGALGRVALPLTT
jgi:hypothetical protein